jgi:hypothetical protein
MKEKRRGTKQHASTAAPEPKVEAYRKEQRDYGGEFSGMNCYNTLFVVDSCTSPSASSLREMETLGPSAIFKLSRKKQTENPVATPLSSNEHEEDMSVPCSRWYED